MRIIVTGGAGFIGSALCRFLIKETEASVLNIDKLTYAANLRSLDLISANPRYTLLKADICDFDAIIQAFDDFEPDALIHLAAESHVDRSITGSSPFIQTNICGTYTLLEARSEILGAIAGLAPGSIPFPACLDRRGLRLSRRPWTVPRGHALRSELALLGEQSCLRPFGSRLAPDIRAADSDLKLLEQLWSLPFP